MKDATTLFHRILNKYIQLAPEYNIFPEERGFFLNHYFDNLSLASDQSSTTDSSEKKPSKDLPIKIHALNLLEKELDLQQAINEQRSLGPNDSGCEGGPLEEKRPERTLQDSQLRQDLYVSFFEHKSFHKASRIVIAANLYSAEIMRRCRCDSLSEDDSSSSDEEPIVKKRRISDKSAFFSKPLQKNHPTQTTHKSPVNNPSCAKETPCALQKHQ